MSQDAEHYRVAMQVIEQKREIATLKREKESADNFIKRLEELIYDDVPHQYQERLLKVVSLYNGLSKVSKEA